MKGTSLSAHIAIAQDLRQCGGRLIEKKVPGAAPIYYCYDPLDRPVLVQDGNLRHANQWVYTKYDIKGRQIISGLYTNATHTTRAAIQAEVLDLLYQSPSDLWYEVKQSGTTHGYSNVAFPASNIDILSVTYYDDHDFNFDGTQDKAYTVQALPNENTSASAYGRVTGIKRKVLGTSSFLIDYIFYDKFGRVIQKASNHHLDYNNINNLTTSAFDFEGKLISSRTNHNNAPDLVNRYEYDAAGRVTNVYGPSPTGISLTWQAKVNVTANSAEIRKTTGINSTWNAGALSIESLAANEDGWVEFKVGETNKNRMAGLSVYNTGASYTTINFALYPTDNGTLQVYENGGLKANLGSYTVNDVFKVERREGNIFYWKNNTIIYTSLQTSSAQLFFDCAFYTTNGSISNAVLFKPQEIRLANYQYNELGQLVDKKLHHTGNDNYLQSIDYRYNIKGWLKSINGADLGVTSDNDDTNDYFGMDLLYNNQESGVGNSASYNGNISGIKWKGIGGMAGTEDQRVYKYEYDHSDRLFSANYAQRTDTGWDKDAEAFNEQLAYDANGNITQLNRKHLNPLNAVAPMDNLLYTYGSGNKLNQVDDTSGSTRGFNNGSNSSTEFEYDVAGNLKKDLNKGITDIQYNILGKVSKVVFSNNKSIEYVYDAAGTKLTMRNLTGTTVDKTTNYIGSFVYEGTTLKFFGTPEGRAVCKPLGYDYEYSIADHQGNTRVVFTSATPTVQASSTNYETNPGTFLNFPTGGNLSSLTLYNRGTGTKSHLLNGGYNSQVGLAKTFKVYPGDKVKIEAYGKYEENSNTSSAQPLATALLAAWGLSAPAAGEVGTASAALDLWGTVVDGGGQSADPTIAKAFVNIIVFDKNYNFVDAAWEQIESSGRQVGTTPVVPHDYMMSEFNIKEEGYAFVYISNNSPINVYFDDVKFTYTPTNVIQYNEYYPFGLQTTNSWTRDNSSNNYLYNGASELNSSNGWYETFYRGYDAALGRFLQVDPLASRYSALTPYNFAANDPVYWNDPNGDCIDCQNSYVFDGTSDRMQRRAALLYEQGYNVGSSRDWFNQGYYMLAVEAAARREDGGEAGYNKDGVYGYWYDSAIPDSYFTVNGQLYRVQNMGIQSTFVAQGNHSQTQSRRFRDSFNDHFFVELEGDVSVGAQATLVLTPTGQVVAVPYSTTQTSSNVKLWSLNLVSAKVNNKDGKPAITRITKDVHFNQGFGITIEGNSFEFNSEYLNGKRENTVKLSAMGGLLGLEINITKEELFVGMMPSAAWSFGGGISASFKAGFKF